MTRSSNDHESPPKEDTLRETPVAKASEGQISVRPGEWKPPRKGEDVAFDGARIRAYEIKGPLAWLVGMMVLVVGGLIFTLIFAFAIGVGAALAVSAAVAGTLAVGVAGVRRLTASRRSTLSGRDGER